MRFHSLGETHLPPSVPLSLPIQSLSPIIYIRSVSIIEQIHVYMLCALKHFNLT